MVNLLSINSRFLFKGTKVKARNAPPLSSSMEDYLETILEISSENRAVRTKIIADKLGVRQPSVTSALRYLLEKGLIAYEPYGAIALTKEGQAIAETIWSRHVGLRRFLRDVLGVEEGEADEVACKLEHVVSENVMDRLVAFTQFVSENKTLCANWRPPKGRAATSKKPAKTTVKLK